MTCVSRGLANREIFAAGPAVSDPLLIYTAARSVHEIDFA